MPYKKDREARIAKIGIDAYRAEVAQKVRDYYAKNKERKALSNKKWNEKNRNDYQKKYRENKVLNLISTQ